MLFEKTTYLGIIDIVFFRMPPSYSKLLPITQAHANYCYTPKSSRPLPFDEFTPLAYYGKSIDPYLKQVAHLVKEPLESISKIIVHSVLSVKIRSEHGIEELRWELTIKEARRSVCYVRDALVVLHQNYFHNKSLLKHVEQILYEDQKNAADCHPKKISEKDVQQLTKLKEHLLRLNKFLDCILLHYSSFSKESLPDIKEIKRTAKKIFKTINNLTPGGLKNMVPDRITEEDVLCSVLGLKDDLAIRLKTVSEYMRQHKTDIHHLMCFLKERDEPDKLVNLCDIEAVEHGLLKMGFSESRSGVVAKWIAEQPSPEHRSLLAWARIYIENLFKYDIFLNDQVKKFPFKEDTVDKWFLWEVDNCKDEDDHVAQVYVVNTTSKEDALVKIKQKVVEFNEKNPKGNLYFHGTDHIGVVDILKSGIKLGVGTPKCDFSHGYGFYVADNFEYALTEYAMTTQHAALFVFHVSDDCLKKYRGLHLSGPENRKELKGVRDYFRGGEPRRHGLEMKLYKRIKNCDYIFGPVSRDGKDGSKSSNWDNVNQICIRNEEMAEEIGDPSCIEGIIFLNTGNQLARR